MPLKKMSRRAVFWIVVALQGLAVITFAGWREVELRTGTEVVLATVPVDPRDIFRGDYVVLRYEISSLPAACRFTALKGPVFVTLKRTGDVWRYDEWFSSIDPARDTGQPFIAGRFTGRSGSNCNVEYGIENYFVPEGTGHDIERARGTVKVHVVLDDNGVAAIKRVELP